MSTLWIKIQNSENISILLYSHLNIQTFFSIAFLGRSSSSKVCLQDFIKLLINNTYSYSLETIINNIISIMHIRIKFFLNPNLYDVSSWVWESTF